MTLGFKILVPIVRFRFDWNVIVELTEVKLKSPKTVIVIVSYERLEEEVSCLLRRYWTKRLYRDPQGRTRIAEPRVISLDIESAPFKDTDFLTNERILAIAIARRTSGRLASSEGVEVKSWLLKEDSDEGEYSLLEEFNEGLRPEPLAVVGYGIRDYDLPLLSLKMKRYDASVEEVRLRIPGVKKLWHIINTLERAVHLDLMIRLRHKLGKMKFDELLDHQIFSHLPLRRMKHPIPPEGISRGEHFYTIWKEKPEMLKALAEAHAHDVLLIAEHEFFHR